MCYRCPSGEQDAAANAAPLGHHVSPCLSDMKRRLALPNQWSWIARTLCALRRARRTGIPVALALVDLDLLAKVNQEYGPRAAVAEAATATIHSVISVHHIATRYCWHNGDEFLLLLPATTTDGACAVAERIRHGLAAMHVGLPGAGHRGLESFRHTASVGVAGGTLVHGISLPELLRDADEALRKAKRAGRDRISLARTITS